MSGNLATYDLCCGDAQAAAGADRHDDGVADARPPSNYGRFAASPSSQCCCDRPAAGFARTPLLLAEPSGSVPAVLRTLVVTPSTVAQNAASYASYQQLQQLHRDAGNAAQRLSPNITMEHRAHPRTKLHQQIVATHHTSEPATLRAERLAFERDWGRQPMLRLRWWQGFRRRTIRRRTR